MAELKKKIVVRKSTIKKRVKTELTQLELNEIKLWILTGSFTKHIYSDRNKIDLSKIHLLKKAAFTNVDDISRMMLDNSQIAIKKDTLFLILIFLSMGSFHAKKVFRTSFNKIIKTPNDLYKFLSLIKKYRGLGSIIHITIKKWFISKDTSLLEKQFVEERSKYGWSGKDVIRLIKPCPRDKKESKIFKWLSKGKIDFNDLLEYKETLPLIYYYEKLKTNSNIKSVNSIVESHNFNSNMIPGNVNRDDDSINFILSLKNDEELFYYVKNHLYMEIVIDRFIDRLNIILTENRMINVSAVEMISMYNLMVNLNVNSYVLVKLEELIENKIKKMLKIKNDVLHIIDMDNEMFSNKDPLLQISPAVIASVTASLANYVYTFNGIKKNNNTVREIMEAEGRLERTSRITTPNIDKDLIKTVFVWTNRKYLPMIEKSLVNLKMDLFPVNVCLINLGEGKITKKNNRIFTLEGYNQDTKKIMRIIERGIL